MAIVKMSKFNLIVLSSDRDDLLNKLQKFNNVHFLNLHENKTLSDMNLFEIPVEDTIANVDEEIRKVSYSIDILDKYDTRKKGLHQLKEGLPTYDLRELEDKVEAIDFNNIYEQVTNYVSEKENTEQEIKQIDEQMAELKPWVPLNVPLKYLSTFKQCEINLGTVPKKLDERLKQELTETDLTYYQVISEDQQYTYIMTMTHLTEKKVIQGILTNHGFSNIKLDYNKEPVEEISQLTKEKHRLRDKLQALKEKFTRLSAQLGDLELLHDYLTLKKIQVSANEKFLRTEQFSMMEGYIPTKYTSKFEKLIRKQLGEHHYLDMKEARDQDPHVPILLDNPKYFRAFESVTEMYALPKYNEIDPTPWFTIFYALFFGMMIGDAGYGILMFTLTFMVLKALNLTNKQRNFIRFFYYLSFSTILWGAIYGSFFGDMLPLPALINATEEYNMLLILSIALGGIHIFFALGIQGYMDIKSGKPLDALFDVGFWYMALGGAIVYLLTLFLPTFQTYGKTGLTIMIIGMVGILLTGGRNSKGVGGKLAGGLYSLYGISGYIGDFVSYSRLMALGLASAFIAYAINMMVSMLFDLGFFGVILGIIVFVIGQSFNLFLSMLSSYVHTLRLTYVEFFGKFYEGGGTAFQPFRGQSKYINLK